MFSVWWPHNGLFSVRTDNSVTSQKNKIVFSTLRLCQVFLSVCHRSAAASLGDSQTTHQMIYLPCDWQRMTNYLRNGLLDCWELTRLAGSSAVVFLFFFISLQCGGLNSQRLTRQSNWFNIFFFFASFALNASVKPFVSACVHRSSGFLPAPQSSTFSLLSVCSVNLIVPLLSRVVM